MSIREAIERKLQAAFSPERLEVVDESHLHAGHRHHDAEPVEAEPVEAGRQLTFDGAGGTHLRIRIVSPVFSGMTRIERHRAVNDLLGEELAGGVHALAIEPAAPGEPTRW